MAWKHSMNEWSPRTRGARAAELIPSDGKMLARAWCAHGNHAWLNNCITQYNSWDKEDKQSMANYVRGLTVLALDPFLISSLASGAPEARLPDKSLMGEITHKCGNTLRET